MRFFQLNNSFIFIIILIWLPGLTLGSFYHFFKSKVVGLTSSLCQKIKFMIQIGLNSVLGQQPAQRLPLVFEIATGWNHIKISQACRSLTVHFKVGFRNRKFFFTTSFVRCLVFFNSPQSTVWSLIYCLVLLSFYRLQLFVKLLA